MFGKEFPAAGSTMNDIILQKKASLERSIQQITSYYQRPSLLPFKEDFYKQDAIAINIQRACEICIDLANIAIKTKKIGLPSSSRDSFFLLEQAGIIDEKMARNLSKMTGFRNILSHQYQDVDIELMESIITQNFLSDLNDFASIIVRLFQ